MNGIRAGKYAFKAASILVEVLILVILAGPMAGAVSPEFMAQHPVGLGVDLQAIQPQLQQVFSSGSTINGTHDISVPVFNNWPLAGTATLTLAIVEGNQTLYQTQPSTLQLPPFRSGQLDVSIVMTNSLLAQLQGKNVGIGGSESLSEDNYWTITVSLSKS